MLYISPSLNSILVVTLSSISRHLLMVVICSCYCLLVLLVTMFYRMHWIMVNQCVDREIKFDKHI